jgi:hypothetical protein
MAIKPMASARLYLRLERLRTAEESACWLLLNTRTIAIASNEVVLAVEILGVGENLIS